MLLLMTLMFLCCLCTTGIRTWRVILYFLSEVGKDLKIWSISDLVGQAGPIVTSYLPFCMFGVAVIQHPQHLARVKFA